MEQCDFLVVGGGLAGSLMAFELFQHTSSVCWINPDLPGNSSAQAAGLMNPITGRRFVKSWNWNGLMDVAIPYYRSIEWMLNTRFLQEIEIILELKNSHQENAWLSRTADPAYLDYIGEMGADWPFNNILRPANRLGKIAKAYQLNILKLLTKIKDYLKERIVVIPSPIDYKTIEIKGKSIYTQDISVYRSLIFCEGFRMIYNPLFNYLPLVPLKGNFIHVDWQASHLSLAFKSDYSIIPLHEGTAWIGSNYSVHDVSMHCDEEEIQRQIAFAGSKLTHFHCQHRGFGIRPATRDRRPLVGAHPVFPTFFLVNGFGTKGASLAPYCVKMAVGKLMGIGELDSSIDIKRYEHLLTPQLQRQNLLKYWLYK